MADNCGAPSPKRRRSDSPINTGNLNKSLQSQQVLIKCEPDTLEESRSQEISINEVTKNNTQTVVLSYVKEEPRSQQKLPIVIQYKPDGEKESNNTNQPLNNDLNDSHVIQSDHSVKKHTMDHNTVPVANSNKSKVIYITHIPLKWNKRVIQKYLKRTTKNIKEINENIVDIITEEKDNFMESYVVFTSHAIAETAMQMLKARRDKIRGYYLEFTWSSQPEHCAEIIPETVIKEETHVSSEIQTQPEHCAEIIPETVIKEETHVSSEIQTRPEHCAGMIPERVIKEETHVSSEIESNNYFTEDTIERNTNSVVNWNNQNKSKAIYITNIPFEWNMKKLQNHIKNRLWRNKELVDNILDMKRYQRDNIRTAYLEFSSHFLAEEAMKMFEDGRDKFSLHLDGLKYQWSSRPRDWTVDKIPEQTTHTLILDCVPKTWDLSKIKEYIKINTYEEILEDIHFVYLNTRKQQFTGSCLVRFHTGESCVKAFKLLKAAPLLPSQDGIFVKLDKMYASFFYVKKNGEPNNTALKSRFKIEIRQKEIKPAPHQEKYTGATMTPEAPAYVPSEASAYVPSVNPACFSPVTPASVPDEPLAMSWETLPREKTILPPAWSEKFQHCLQEMTYDIGTETFGLSQEFLDMLGIRPPISNKIFVYNVDRKYSNDADIRKVFGHAGVIISTGVYGDRQYNDNGRYKIFVEYDHPVEAVQAVSMYNNQELCGNIVNVVIDTNMSASQKLLPPKLKAFGPGLNLNGSPMKEVRRTIQLLKVKEMLRDEIQSGFRNENQESQNRSQKAMPKNIPCGYENRNQEVQNSQDNQTPLFSVASGNNQQTNLLSALSSLISLQNNPLVSALSGLLNPQATQNVISQCPTQHNVGTNLINPSSSQDSPFNTQATSRPGWNSGCNSNIPVSQNIQTRSNMQSGVNIQDGITNVRRAFNSHGGRDIQAAAKNFEESNIIPSYHHNSESLFDVSDRRLREPERTVLISYLPPRVTLEKLELSLRDIGEIKTAEMLRPGHAKVVFYSLRDARNCVALLDKSIVGGQVIDVNFL